MQFQKIQVRHLPSDYPTDDMVDDMRSILGMESIADQEMRHGEDRSVEAGDVDPE
jgi:hypothetical protein